MGVRTQLFPSFQNDLDLEGLYLQDEIPRQDGRSFFYANFITSLDGRIAVLQNDHMGVPENIANPRDWRLFQELAAQADLVITTGRYLRDYAEGRAQEILEVYNRPEYADLVAWRENAGMSRQPDLAVISRTLDFPIPEGLISQERRVLVITTEDAKPDEVTRLQNHFGEVFPSGETSVEGMKLKSILEEQGYRAVYSAAGPRVLHLLLNDGVLNRLYLTMTSRIIGGSTFASIVEGSLFSSHIDLRLEKLFYDAEGLDGVGQLFTRYEVVT